MAGRLCTLPLLGSCWKKMPTPAICRRITREYELVCVTRCRPRKSAPPQAPAVGAVTVFTLDSRRRGGRALLCPNKSRNACHRAIGHAGPISVASKAAFSPLQMICSLRREVGGGGGGRRGERVGAEESWGGNLRAAGHAEPVRRAARPSRVP